VTRRRTGASRPWWRRRGWALVAVPAVIASGAVVTEAALSDDDGPSLAAFEYVHVSDRGGSAASVWRGRLGRQPSGRVGSGEGRAPAWKPDGTAFAYVTRDDGGFGVRVVSHPSGRARTVATDTLPISAVTWSPDGRRLVFDRSDSGGGQRLVVLDLARRTERVLLQRPTRALSAPAWRPVTGSPEIALVEIEDGDVGRVGVIDDRGRRRWRSRDESYSPAWRGDGDALALVRWTGDEWQLVVTNQRGAALRVVWRDRALLYAPSWTPDGRWIVFERYREEAPDLWVVPAEGGRARPLLRRDGFDGNPAVRPAPARSEPSG